MKNDALKFTLDDYMDSLCKTHGMELCLYDIEDFIESGGLTLSKKKRVHSCAFCDYVKSSPEGLVRCIHEDHRLLQSVPENQSYCICRCHAGLLQMVVPLRFQGKLLGGLFWGQRLPRSYRQENERFRALTSGLHLSLHRLDKVIDQTPTTTIKHLRESGTLLFLLRDFILNSYCLHLQSSGFSFNGERTVSPEISLSLLPAPPLPKTDCSQAIQTAVEIIRKNYWRGLTREAIAGKISLSPSQFSRRFRSETGLCYRHYVQQNQISAAAHLLKHTHLTVEVIARKVGFSSSAAFNRSFKSLTGFSPRDFMFSNARYPWEDR